ncbi:DUF2927 domain-containing protein [Tropicimonas sp. S265A]|uniref:DUF2927 domain-containing protein n=1 Tax=Tropicimonas sp. S265A TaxID=3415134 RepID=UPI003C7D1EF3
MAIFSRAFTGCLTACALSVGGVAGADVVKSTRAQGPSDELSAYYAKMQRTFQDRGLLKTIRTVPQSSMTAASLKRDFLEIALHTEYGGGLSASGSKAAKPLLRWEEPVRLQVMFGASVPKDRRIKDLKAISSYTNTLARLTRHPMTVNPNKPNFHVIVVNEAERKSLSKTLPKLVPGISKSVVRNIAKMRPNHLCLVVAEPHADRSRGFKRAVAIVRAEHPDVMRASCIQEELAQGLGLSNDCREAYPSIFNDDQEFALLTRRDEVLLRMLYDPKLRSGMSADEVSARLPEITKRAM